MGDKEGGDRGPHRRRHLSSSKTAQVGEEYKGNTNIEDKNSLGKFWKNYLFPQSWNAKFAEVLSPKGEGTVRVETNTTDEGPKVGILGLFRYSKPFDRLLMVLGTIFSITMGASLPVLGFIFGEMTDVFVDVTKRGFKNETLECHDQNCSSVDDRITKEDFTNYMDVCSIYYLLIGFSAFISTFLQTFCWEYSCERQSYSLRRLYFLQVLRQDVSWFENNKEGDLSTKLSDDIERIREGIGIKIGIVIQYVSTFFTGIMIGLYADWSLTLCLLIVFPLIYYVASFSSQENA